MRAADIADQLTKVLVTEEEIDAKLAEMAEQVTADYEGKDLLWSAAQGAVMVMSDFARHLSRDVTMDWMAVSSYGVGTKSSGVVQIRKDLDADLTGRHVLIVEDIIDTGLTLHWLLENFASRGARSSRGPGPAAQARRGEGERVLPLRRLRHPERLRR